MEPRFEQRYLNGVMNVLKGGVITWEFENLLEISTLLPQEKAGVAASIIFVREWKNGKYGTADDLLVLSKIMERTLGAVPEIPLLSEDSKTET